jgi:bacteriorhodopsin
MTHWRMTRVVGAGVGLGMVVVGWLALFTWDPTPPWARWTLGAGAMLAILAGVMRQPGG